MPFSRARALDLGVTALGLSLLTYGARWVERDDAILPLAASAFAMGLGARLADSRARPAVGDGFAVVAMLLVATAGLATHDWVIERWIDQPEDTRFSTPVLSMLALMRAAPSIVALGGWALRSGALPFVIGAYGAALLVWPITDAAPAMVVLAFTLARFAGTPPDAALPLRQRPVLVALGFVVALTALGPLFDVAAALQPDDWERLSVRVDQTWSFALRVGLELAVIASAWAFARGRAGGLLGLSTTGPALVLTVVFDLLTHRLPGWVSGCFGASHPLRDLGGYVLLGVLTALLPWLLALGRALSPDADNRREQAVPDGG